MKAEIQTAPAKRCQGGRIGPTALVWLMTLAHTGLAANELERNDEVAGFFRAVDFDDRWLRTVRVADATRRERGFYGGVPTAKTGSLDWLFKGGEAEVGLTHIRDLMVAVDLEIHSSGSDARGAFRLFRGLVMRTIAGLVGPPEAANGDWDVAIWSGMLIIGGLSAPIMNPPPEVVWSWALIEAACGSLELPLDDTAGTMERSWELHVSKPRSVTLALTTRSVPDVDWGLSARKECSATIGYGDVLSYGP